MRAKEYGIGYRVEWEDTLYLVPTSLVLIDEGNRFHSETKPAIRWKKGKEFYYLHGINFDNDLWEKTINKKLSAEEIMRLENMEQRMIALKYYGIDNILKDFQAQKISQTPRNELYLIKNLIPDRDVKMLKYICPSTGRLYSKFVPFEMKNADEAQAWAFSISLEEYNYLKFES